MDNLKLKQLRETVVETVHHLDKDDKQRAARVLIQDILQWTSLSSTEALGVIEESKFQLLLKCEELREKEEEIKPKKRQARTIGRR